MAATLLDAVADTGATNASPGSFSVTAGTDRVLFYILHSTGNVDTITGVDYGGQAMTLLVQATNILGFHMRVRIFALNDAGIVAASDTDFSVTGASNGNFKATGLTIQDADQSLTTIDTAVVEASLDGTSTPIDVEAGGIVVATGATTNPTDIAWTGITERLELDPSQTASTAFDATGTTETINLGLTITGSGGAGQAMAAVSLAAAESSVSLLDAWTAITEGASFVPSAGTNRAVVVAAHEEGTDTDITGITYGDQTILPATRGVILSTTDAFRSTGGIFVIDEATLAAATGTTITVNEDAVPQADNTQIFVATFENVDQLSPILDEDGSFNNTGAAGSVTLDTGTDAFAVAIFGSGSVIDIAWTLPFIEQLEEDDGSSSSAVSHVATDGTQVTAAITATGTVIRSVLAALSLRRFSDLTQGSGTATATFGGGVNEQVERAASATVQTDFGGTAAAGRLVGASTSTSFAFQSDDADALILTLASGTATFNFSTQADANPSVGVSVSGQLAFGGTANAEESPPPIPEILLSDSFSQAQRPAILVDLFFDEGEVNIWTRPVSGIFNGKQYNPLAGVTSGITVRNSLDDSSLDVSVQLSGQSDELLNLALTSNFQRRRAVIRLANLNENYEVESEEIIIIGTISNMPITDSAEESTVSVLIDSVFREVNRPRVLRLSAADQALINPDDSFFNFTETDSVQAQTFGGI